MESAVTAANIKLYAVFFRKLFGFWKQKGEYKHLVKVGEIYGRMDFFNYCFISFHHIFTSNHTLVQKKPLPKMWCMGNSLFCKGNS